MNDGIYVKFHIWHKDTPILHKYSHRKHGQDRTLLVCDDGDDDGLRISSQQMSY